MIIKVYEDGHWRLKQDKDEDLLLLKSTPAMGALRAILSVIDQLPEEQMIAGRQGLAELIEDVLSYPQLIHEHDRFYNGGNDDGAD